MNISCKDGLNKAQKWYDLTEAEDIKKTWQESTEELYKTDHDPDNHDNSPRARHPGMQSQVGLRKHHYKARRGDGIQLSYFKS